jgi:hypothetical protein
VAYGYNNYRSNKTKCNRSIHAEEHMILKLPYNRRKRITIDVLIIRISRAGKLLLSAPCSNCLKKLKSIKGYRVRNIYYSTEAGTICALNLNNFKMNNYTSKYFRGKK